LLFEIRAERELGVRVSREEHQSLFEELVVGADREGVGGITILPVVARGTLCGIFWPTVEKFVERYGLVHILGIGNEFQANKGGPDWGIRLALSKPPLS